MFDKNDDACEADMDFRTAERYTQDIELIGDEDDDDTDEDGRRRGRAYHFIAEKVVSAE